MKRSAKPRRQEPASATLKERLSTLPAVAIDGAHIDAQRLARTMPLVHFPARSNFREWRLWEKIVPAAMLPGRPVNKTLFGRLRAGHVFTYGGPCCYQPGGAAGDAAMYFAPTAEDGFEGSASPFDSGALEPPTPKLMPFARLAIRLRYSWFQTHCVGLTEWRETFAMWLAACYADPMRYLETTTDRYRDGTPDRTVPDELRAYNGALGRSQYGSKAADRRAWTWEVRFEAPLPLDRGKVLHIAYDQLQDGLDWADRMRSEMGVQIAVRALIPQVAVSARALYEDSGELLRELTQ